MNLLRITRIIGLFLFIGIAISPLQAKDADKAHPQPSPQEKAFIQTTFNASASCIQQIDEIIGHLAILISNHQIKGLANPGVAIRTLIEYRQLLGGLLQAISADLDAGAQIQLSIALLKICDEFITLIESGLKSNLKQLKPFNIQAIAKKRSALEQNPTPEKLKKEIQSTQKRIASLKTKAGNAGLTWYNKTARSIDKHLVTRWNKWHCTPILKYTAAAAVLAGYGIIKYGKNMTFFDEKKFFHSSPEAQAADMTIRDLLDKWFHGVGWSISPYTGKIVKPGEIEDQRTQQQPSASNTGFASIETINSNQSNDKITLLGTLSIAIDSLLKNDAPLAMLGATWMWTSSSETWNRHISPWFNKKRNQIWNYLRGGSYQEIEEPGLFSFEPECDFDDMIGLEEVKEELATILQYIADPDKSARSKVVPETGWILTGPTRTGKTFSFECLCGEVAKMQRSKGGSTYKFMKIEVDLLNEAGIKQVINYAKNNAPMILFIDEIDLLGLNRVSNSERLMSFLTQLQEASNCKKDPSKALIVITATNCPETLDKALRQNGRLGKEIRFEYPTFKYRKIFLMKELAKMALDYRNFDIDSLVAKTHERSYEDLQAIIRATMIHAWALGKPFSQELLEDSISKEIKKIIMLDRKELPESESRILATHFAGKALAMLLLDTHAKLDLVTTKAIMTELCEKAAWHVMAEQATKTAQEKIVHGGVFTKVLHDTIQLKTATHIVNEIKGLLAGFVAEEIIFGTCSMQCNAQDYTKAYDIVDKLVFEGIWPGQMSKAKRDELHDKTYSLIQQYRQETKKLLEEHHTTLVVLTDELMKNSIMTDKQVQAVIDKVENKIVEPASAIEETKEESVVDATTA